VDMSQRISLRALPDFARQMRPVIDAIYVTIDQSY